MTGERLASLRHAAYSWPYRGVHHDKGFREEPWNDEMIAVVVDSLAESGLVLVDEAGLAAALDTVLDLQGEAGRIIASDLLVALRDSTR